MSKWICVPEPVKLKEMVTRKETGDEYAFWRFIQMNILSDIRFGATWKAGRMAERISDKLFEAKPGTWVELESADYDLLKQCAEEPQHGDSRQPVKGYDPLLLQQVGKFVEAIVDGAKDKAPESQE